MGAWITTVAPEDAQGRLRELYESVRTPHGTVDNVMRAHSLRPETMAGHLALYRAVLHNPENVLPLAFLETVAAEVSRINGCAYSLAHHRANAERLIGDPARAGAVWRALAAGRPEEAFPAREAALLAYAAKLTRTPGAMARADWQALKEAGCADGEILEVNQVAAYFAYSNRLLNGLGVDTEGDVIGYYEAPASAGRET